MKTSGNNIMQLGIYYEAMMRWVGCARNVSALGRVAVEQHSDMPGDVDWTREIEKSLLAST